MTIAVIITTHGQAAQALLSTAEMIIGQQDNVRCVDFVPGENGEILANKIQRASEELDSSAGLLLIVDLWGGTPFNAANTIANNTDNTEVITGVNVPMLVSLLLERDDTENISELTSISVNAAKDGIKALKTEIVSVANAPTPTPSSSDGENNLNTAQKCTEEELIKMRKEASCEVQDVPHMSFGLWRIDDRLIHGQVATRWTKETGVNRIIIVNDQIAKDKTRITMLKQAVPSGVSAHVVSVDKMMRVYNNPQYQNDSVMLLFTNPTDALELVKRGIKVDSINIGGMAYKDGRTMLDSSVSVNESDVAAFKELDKLGIELEVRKVASDRKVPVLQLIADKYKSN